MLNRSFAERIRNAERLLGTVVSFPSPEVAEILALCGFDWLLVDAGPAGFNALFVDPYGISASVGLPGQLGHPEVTAAISRVQHFCEDAERRCGIFAHDLDSSAKWLGANFNLVAVTSDAMMLGHRARDMLQVLR